MFTKFMSMVYEYEMEDMEEMKALFVMRLPKMETKKMFLMSMAKKAMEMRDEIPMELKMRLMKLMMGKRMKMFQPFVGGKNKMSKRDPMEFMKKMVPTLAESFNCDAVDVESEEFQEKMQSIMGSIALKMLQERGDGDF